MGGKSQHLNIRAWSGKFDCVFEPPATLIGRRTENRTTTPARVHAEPDLALNLNLVPIHAHTTNIDTRYWALEAKTAKRGI
jgi:hypothetical protein